MNYHESLGIKIELQERITEAKHQRHALLNNLGVDLIRKSERKEALDYVAARALLNGAEQADLKVADFEAQLKDITSRLPPA